jgi:hypothetical protein
VRAAPDLVLLVDDVEAVDAVDVPLEALAEEVAARPDAMISMS